VGKLSLKGYFKDRRETKRGKKVEYHLEPGRRGEGKKAIVSIIFIPINGGVAEPFF